MNTLPIGTISHGTLRTEDLLSAFIEALESVDHDMCVAVKADYAKVFSLLDSGKWDNLNYDIQTHAQLLDDADYLVNEKLPDLLNEYTPEYTYFGVHEGDGSDFGVWPCQEEIEMAINDGSLISINDLSDIDAMIAESSVIPKAVIMTNDHGNMTLGKLVWEVEEVWSIV